MNFSLRLYKKRIKNEGAFRKGAFAFCCLVVSVLVIPVELLAQPNRTMGEAQKAFRARRYEQAAKLFYMVAVTADGGMRDSALFSLAESLKKLKFFYGASYFYARIAMQGPRSDFFRVAMEALAQINTRAPLGRATVIQLAQNSSKDLAIPNAARGFYFYYRGLDSFDKQNLKGARAEFSRVPVNDPYYPRAQYHLGVILTLEKELSEALSAFNRVVDRTSVENLSQLATINIARVYYESKRYREAFKYYAKIPRDSDLWLQTLFEGAWAFFMIQKHNNTLGNIHTIHSPFFQNRFFPETYILNAITYLRLCRFKEVEKQIRSFQQRYKPTYADLNGLLRKFKGQPGAFYNLIRQYRSENRLTEFEGALEIVDSIARSDIYKESNAVLSGIEKELIALDRVGNDWDKVNLSAAIKEGFDQRKDSTIRLAGKDMFAQGLDLLRFLKDLEDQTKLISLEILSGKTDELRSKLANEEQPVDNSKWGEGMRELRLDQEIEYWPFEGEYWEDELGGYVYNLDSRCSGKANKKKAE